MLLPRLMLVARRLPLNLASVVLFGLIPMASWGQQPPAAPSAQAVPQPAQPQAIHLQDYSQPRSALSECVSALQSAGTGAAKSRQLAAH